MIWNIVCWYFLVGMLVSAATLLNGAPAIAAVDACVRIAPFMDRNSMRWIVVLVCLLYVAIIWPRMLPSAYRIVRNLCR